MQEKLGELVDLYENGEVSRRELISRVTGIATGMAILGAAGSADAQQAGADSPEIAITPEWRTKLIQRLANITYDQSAVQNPNGPNRYIAVKDFKPEIWEGLPGDIRGAQGHHKWLFDGYGGKNGIPGVNFMEFTTDSDPNPPAKKAMEYNIPDDTNGNVHKHDGVRPGNGTKDLELVQTILKAANQLGILNQAPAKKTNDKDRPPYKRDGIDIVYEDVYHVIQHKVTNSVYEQSAKFARAVCYLRDKGEGLEDAIDEVTRRLQAGESVPVGTNPEETIRAQSCY